MIETAKYPPFSMVKVNELGVKNFEIKLEDACKVPKK